MSGGPKRRGIKRRLAGVGVELVLAPSPNSHRRAPGYAKVKTRGRPGPCSLPLLFPRPVPTSSSPGLPGAETPSSPGPGVSHREEAVTERTARFAHSEA